MRTATIKTLGLLALLCGVAAVQGQQPGFPPPKAKSESPTNSNAPKKPEPGSLEEMLDQAMKNSPEILKAQAKVREAEVNLSIARQQVVHKVIALRTELEAARRVAEASAAQFEIQQTLHKRGTLSASELANARIQMERAKAEVAKLQGELDALLGVAKGLSGRVNYITFSPDGDRLYTRDELGRVRLWDPTTGREIIDSGSSERVTHILSGTKRLIQAPMAERIRKELDKPVKWEGLKGPTNFKAALDLFRKQAGVEVPFRYLRGPSECEQMTMSAGELPVGAWLQAFEDSMPDVRFVVREYGILVTTKDRVPEGAMSVQDFWRRAADKPKSQPEAKKEQPQRR